LQAAKYPAITSLRHTRVTTEPSLRQLVPLLDGTHDRDALVIKLAGEHATASDRQNITNSIDALLKQLASASLLVNG
jgi:hypothetical protein